MKSITAFAPGVSLCLLVGILALLLSSVVPIGAVAVAILLGIAAGNLLHPSKIFKTGVAACERKVLAFAIALMGVNLDYTILGELGFESILLIVAAIAVTICSALVLGRVLGMERRQALLLGIGNGICGSSAIAATKDIIGAREEEVGLSVAIVNFLGTIGIFLMPLIGVVVLDLTDIEAGLLIGNTLQAVGHVLASGFSISESAGQTAAIVKMTRVLMLTPVILILVFSFSGRRRSDQGAPIKKYNLPPFIVGFFLFSLVPTFGLLPGTLIGILSRTSHYALITAMAGIGLGITFDSILKHGRSALLLGGLVFMVQILFSGCMIGLLPG